MQSSYGEAAWNRKDFRPMHIFYLTPIVNPWFPGICYKYGTKKCRVDNVQKSRNWTNAER